MSVMTRCGAPATRRCVHDWDLRQYIAILFDDCGYTSAQRRDWFRSRFDSAYADELTTEQKSQAIELLIAEKANNHAV